MKKLLLVVASLSFNQVLSAQVVLQQVCNKRACPEDFSIPQDNGFEVTNEPVKENLIKALPLTKTMPTRVGTSFKYGVVILDEVYTIIECSVDNIAFKRKTLIKRCHVKKEVVLPVDSKLPVVTAFDFLKMLNNGKAQTLEFE